jgi:guanine nucleotide-binding protein G(i) subunit alpha
MHCCGVASDQSSTEASRQIDKFLKEEKRSCANKIKLLLLGIGDAGKSTFMKQMKLLHKNGFTPVEIERYKRIIHDNILTSMKQILEYTERSNIKLSSKLQNSITAVIKASELSPDVAQHVKALWAHKSIKKVWEKHNLYAGMTCAEFYFNSLDRITAQDYTPTPEDILRSKMRTTGVTETVFESSGIEFTIVDVGGQRSERRKWLHVFENITAVIYLAALDAYDMTLEEAPEVNRMEESLRVFSEITSSQWFRNTAFILFLNKSDLFAEKIKRKPLSDIFPDYKGGDDFAKALEFVRQKYIQHFGGQTLYHYDTCALDTKCIENVFGSVKKILIDQALKQTGFI